MTLGLGLRTRMREVGSSTPASVLHAKSQTLEPTAAVEPAQHGAKVDGGSRRPSAFPAESLEPISCSPTAVGVTVAVQSHVQVQARKAMERGKQQEASKPLAKSQWSAAATRCGAKGPSIVGEDAKTRPLARGRARGERRSPSAAHASSGWGRSIPADRLDISSATAGAQRTVSREWIRESLMGVPALYRGPSFHDPDWDPFQGEEDPEWVVLRGFGSCFNVSLMPPQTRTFQRMFPLRW